MAIVAMLIRGALANALTFTGSSYLLSRLSKDSIDTKRKRHNLAIEQLQKLKSSGHRKDNNKLILSINNSDWGEQPPSNEQHYWRADVHYFEHD